MPADAADLSTVSETDHLLRSARTKLGRARTHLKELQASFDAYRTDHPMAVDHHVSDDGREHTFTARVATLPPTEEWSAIIGDFLHNLRAALDHALFECMESTVPVANRSDGGDRQVQFPLLDNEAKYRADRDRMVGGITSTRILDVIDAAQPWATGLSDGESHALADLHRLELGDKHRALSVVVVTASLDEETDPFDFDLGEHGGTVVAFAAGRTTPGDGDVVATVEFSTAADVIRAPTTLRIEDLRITIDSEHSLRGEHLNTISRTVEGLVARLLQALIAADQ